MKQVNNKKTGKIRSFGEIKRDDWTIQMSVVDEHYILIIITSDLTGQAIIRYFDDEELAADFAEYVCQLDAKQEQDI